MKQQSTPSLILEGYKQTDAHKLREAEKWLFWIKEYLEIPEDKYRTLEVVFRQLLIHPKMNTAFAYQFDEHFKLSSDSKKITMNLLLNQTPILIVQKILGHLELKTTQYYIGELKKSDIIGTSEVLFGRSKKKQGKLKIA
ncbi:MAG: hypothetical protein ACK5P5_03245 [Pseudobdellovibrionaceae bacterium]